MHQDTRAQQSKLVEGYLREITDQKKIIPTDIICAIFNSLMTSPVIFVSEWGMNIWYSFYTTTFMMLNLAHYWGGQQ